MSQNQKRFAKQRGFSLLTGFILTIIMFGTLAFFMAGQGVNAGFGSIYSNTSKVSGLITSGGYINTGFDAVLLGGTVPASVTFDTTATTGIFNPTSGGASQQALDPTLFVDVHTPATATAAASGLHGYWIYRRSDISLNTVGTAATEFTMLVSGLKQGICQQINLSLYGVNTIPTLTGFTEALLVAGSPPGVASNNTVTGLSANLTTLGIAGRMNGCYSTTDPFYVYIHTLLAQ
jgi:hypothetical protein